MKQNYLKRKKKIFRWWVRLVALCVISLCLCGCDNANVDNAKKLFTNEDLKEKKFGVTVGTNEDDVLNNYYDNPQIEYFNSNVDLKKALDSGKIDSMILDRPIAEYVSSLEKGYRIIDPPICEDNYGVIFKKKDKESAKLCKKVNDFIEKYKKNGLCEKMHSKWFCKDNDKQVVDVKSLKNKNGKLKLALSSSVGPPFIYYRNNKLVGYDVEFAYQFCKEYGYALEIGDYDYNSFFSGVLNKCDFALCCITVTDERKEHVLFSNPYYTGGYTNFVKENNSSSIDNALIASIKEGIDSTLIREDRWKMFCSGGISTVRIVLFSIICGTVLGMILYLLYRRKIKVVNKIFDILIYLIQGMPVIVFLMFLFYVIFVSDVLGGEIVSIIAFSIIFGIDVLDLMKVSVETVDIMQEEAAIALGYSKRQVFFKIILKQAIRFFLPVYKTKIKTLIKETSVVGYISVQDLTKVGDIIRSRTFQPFFSLIVIAIIYYGITAVFNIIINLILRKFDIKLRNKEKILRGIKVIEYRV